MPDKEIGNLNSINDRLIEHCLSQIFNENTFGFNGLKTKLISTISEMGVTVTSKMSPFFGDLKKFFDCSQEDFRRWPSSEATFRVEVRSILIEWIEKKEELIFVGSNKSGQHSLENNTSLMVDGILVPLIETFYCKFRDTALTITLELDEKGNIKVQSDGYLSNDFIEELTNRVNTNLIEKIKGKEVGINLKEIKIRHYSREQLMYPKQTAKNIDNLIRCFKKWQSDQRVMNWGAMLIGKRGSGKTTIGGLISSLRGEGTTFFYVPAGEIEEADDLRRIFEIAKLLSPVIIQIDEVDLISKDRRYGNSEKLVF